MPHDAYKADSPRRHFERFPPTLNGLAEKGDGQERHIEPPSGLQAR
jgi:hypothetical protein